MALMNDKIMEQKFIEIHEQLDRLKIKEASLLEQQNELTNSIAAYENLNMELEEQKKAQVNHFVAFNWQNHSSFVALMLKQAARELQIDEMDIDISRRMRCIKLATRWLAICL